MPDSFMPAYSQSSQPDPAKLKESSIIIGDVAPQSVNVPNVTAVADAISHDLNGGLPLYSQYRYLVQVVPDDPTHYVRGWLCPDSPAVAGSGPVIDSNNINQGFLVCVDKIDADYTLSFIRDPATAHPCKIYLTLRETRPFPF
jgi:hypothetical protein